MCMTKGRCSPSEYHLTNTNLVLLPGKPWSITLTFSIRCLSKYLCIYVYRSCMKVSFACFSIGTCESLLVCRSLVLQCLIRIRYKSSDSCHSRVIGPCSNGKVTWEWIWGKKYGDRAKMSRVNVWNGWKVRLRMCRLRTVPLLALLIEDWTVLTTC